MRQHVVQTLLPDIEAVGGTGVYTSARADLLGGEVSLHAERVARSISRNGSDGCADATGLVRQLLTSAHRIVLDIFNSTGIPVCSGSDSTQMIVVVFVCVDGCLRHVVVYASPVAVTAPPLRAPPGRRHVAYIVGPPRNRPEIKNIAWIRDRKDLESRAARASTGMSALTSCDALLCTETGDLLEGLITNLFVIVEMPEGKEGVRYKLQTAPESMVLAGVARGKVIEACRRLGVTIDVTCPKPSERHTWLGAFLTNSVRQIQTLDGIICADANVWGLDAWELYFGQDDSNQRESPQFIINRIANNIT